MVTLFLPRPSVPREWKVESPARRKSSRNGPLRRSQWRTPLKTENWSFQWTFVQNLHHVLGNVVFLLCNDKSLCTSVLPHLFLFRSYMSGVWMRKVCVNMYIISCCCCWQSSVKWGSEKALVLREACNSFTGCIICPFGKVKAMLLQA